MESQYCDSNAQKGTELYFQANIFSLAVKSLCNPCLPVVIFLEVLNLREGLRSTQSSLLTFQWPWSCTSSPEIDLPFCSLFLIGRIKTWLAGENLRDSWTVLDLLFSDCNAYFYVSLIKHIWWTLVLVSITLKRIVSIWSRRASKIKARCFSGFKWHDRKWVKVSFWIQQCFLFVEFNLSIAIFD